MKKVSLRLFVITISIMLLIGGGIILWISLKSQPVFSQSNDIVHFEYGDSMSTFPVTDCDGVSFDQIPASDKYSLVFYLSDSCSGCLDIIQNFRKIECILGKDEINYVILWTKEIPLKILDKYSVSPNYCYSLNGKTKFATSTPSFYILDPNQEVVFSATDADYLVSKLSQLNIIPPEKLKENTINYIDKNILPQNAKQKQIVYFEMEGCSDCEAANKVMDSEAITSICEITRIFKFDDTDPSHVKDDYGLFKTGLGIQWYPSFLIFEDGKVRFVGETPVEELEEAILG